MAEPWTSTMPAAVDDDCPCMVAEAIETTRPDPDAPPEAAIVAEPCTSTRPDTDSPPTPAGDADAGMMSMAERTRDPAPAIAHEPVTTVGPAASDLSK